MNKKYFSFLPVLFVCCLPFVAQAISTEGSELNNDFISPFDKPENNAQLGNFDGVSIQFKATVLPSNGSADHTYEWGFSVSTDGAETNCGSQNLFAAFRSDGQGNRKFAFRGLSNRNTCESKLEVKDFAWQENQWYELSLSRENYITERLSQWTISVKNLSDSSESASVSYTTTAKNGIDSAMILSRLRNSQCSDSDWRVEWRKPVGILNGSNYRIGRANFGVGEGACGKSTQDLLSTCGLHWTHQMGGRAANPVGTYAYSEIHKEPMACLEIADGMGVEVAKSYVNAIANGGSTQVGTSPTNFTDFGCTFNSVWKDDCQSQAYNGQGGKIFMMNAITPVSSGDNWAQSNIKDIIPETLMRRVMTDPEFTKPKAMFGYISDPENNWFPWMAGEGQGKQILRRYMDSMQ